MWVQYAVFSLPVCFVPHYYTKSDRHIAININWFFAPTISTWYFQQKLGPMFCPKHFANFKFHSHLLHVVYITHAVCTSTPRDKHVLCYISWNCQVFVIQKLQIRFWNFVSAKLSALFSAQRIISLGFLLFRQPLVTPCPIPCTSYPFHLISILFIFPFILFAILSLLFSLKVVLPSRVSGDWKHMWQEHLWLFRIHWPGTAENIAV